MEKFLIDFSSSLIENNLFLSFLFFFISQSLQILFPPYPGDMILILEGYLTGLANLNLILVFVNAITATSLSSVLLFNIGSKEEEKILHSKVINFLFNTKKILKLEKMFKRFGPIVIIVSKFIPGIFSITVLAAGIFNASKKWSYLSILIVTSIHHIALILLGKVLEDNWKIIFDRINIYNKYILVALIIGAILYISALTIKRKIFQ